MTNRKLLLGLLFCLLVLTLNTLSPSNPTRPQTVLAQTYDWVTYDDTDPLFQYESGTWQQVSVAAAYNGTLSYTEDYGAVLHIPFHGTGVELLYSQGSGGATFQTQLLDATQNEVPSTSRFTNSDATDLSYGHTITYENLPEGDYTLAVFNTEGYLWVEGVRIQETCEEWCIYSDRTPKLAYNNGIWQEVNVVDTLRGTVTYTSSPQATVTIAFQGTAISLAYSKGPDGDDFTFQLDDRTPDIFSSYNQTYSRHYETTYFNLEAGLHTVTVTNGEGTLWIEGVRIMGYLVDAEEVSLSPSSSISGNTELSESMTLLSVEPPPPTESGFALSPETYECIGNRTYPNPWEGHWDTISCNYPAYSNEIIGVVYYTEPTDYGIGWATTEGSPSLWHQTSSYPSGRFHCYIKPNWYGGRYGNSETFCNDPFVQNYKATTPASNYPDVFGGNNADWDNLTLMPPNTPFTLSWLYGWYPDSPSTQRIGGIRFIFYLSDPLPCLVLDQPANVYNQPVIPLTEQIQYHQQYTPNVPNEGVIDQLPLGTELRIDFKYQYPQNGILYGSEHVVRVTGFRKPQGTWQVVTDKRWFNRRVNGSDITHPVNQPCNLNSFQSPPSFSPDRYNHIQELREYGVEIQEEVGKTWSDSELTTILTSVQKTSNAFLTIRTTQVPRETFREIIVNGDNPEYLVALRLPEIALNPPSPYHRDYSAYYGSLSTDYCGSFQGSNGVPRTIVCRGNVSVTEYTIVHELGHIFDNRSGRDLYNAVIASLDTCGEAPSIDDLDGKCVVDSTTNVVMGAVYDPATNKSEWRRGDRGWGSGPGFSDFQQHPTRYTANEDEKDETAADMFLNWVYRANTNNPPSYGIVPGTWQGFLNKSWAQYDTYIEATCNTASGCNDPRYPGDARFAWIDHRIRQILNSELGN